MFQLAVPGPLVVVYMDNTAGEKTKNCEIYNKHLAILEVLFNMNCVESQKIVKHTNCLV